jgi:DNA helicase-2/ATP-dependent DNA helicase PcrA
MNLAAPDSTCRPACLAWVNDRQHLAVKHGDRRIAGPLLVIAAPGDRRAERLNDRTA